MYGSLITNSVKNGATESFMRDQPGTLGVSAALFAITLVTPLTARPKRLIMKDTDPRQCAITCSGPVVCWRMIYRRWIVEQSNVVHVETMGREVVGIPITHSVVEAPDVTKSVVEQKRHKVVVFRHDEHVGRGCQPVDDHHGVVAWARRTTGEASQTETELVCGAEWMERNGRVAYTFERVQGNLALHILPFPARRYTCT